MQRTPSTSGCSVGPRWLESAASTSTFNAPRTGRCTIGSKRLAVWFTPDLAVTYRPRGSVAALAKQYFHYGRWRHVIARHHEGTVNLRYLAPPTMVAGTSAALVAGLAWPWAWLVPVAYAAAITVGGVVVSKGEAARTRALTPLALATMHWSWGAGYLTSPRRLAAATRRPVPTN